MLSNVRRRGIEVLVVLCTVITVGLQAVIPGEFALYSIGACLLLGVALLSFVNPAFMLYFIILTSAMCGLIRSLDSLSFGETNLTISGIRWAFVAGIVLFITGVNFRRINFPNYLFLFVIFDLWVAARWLSSSHETTGLKDILFYGLPPFIGLYTLYVFSIRGEQLVGKIEKLVSYSVFIPIILYIILIPTDLVELTKNGPKGWISGRALATYLLTVLSLSLAQWRYATTKGDKNRGIFVSILALGTIGFTLSRMAIATALLLFGMARINPLRIWRNLPYALLTVGLCIALLFGVPSLRNRFFYQSPSSAFEALRRLRTLEDFNTSGRIIMWPAVFNQALKNPIVGWGPGNARLLVGQVLSAHANRQSREYPPHNEYLQVFNDLGIIGLVLLLSAWLLTLVRYWKGWQLAHYSGDLTQAKWHLTVTLCIAAVLINAAVDNTLHYTSILGPIFIIVGCTEYLKQHEALAATD